MKFSTERIRGLLLHGGLPVLYGRVSIGKRSRKRGDARV
jgi:hypothetical protein